MAGNIDWDAIHDKLPTATSDEDKARRKQMFKDFDNGNGILSLAEVDGAVRSVLMIDEVFDAKPAIMRAFKMAKGKYESKRGKTGDDYIERREFKFFLISLRQSFEYHVAFDRIDVDDDKRIDLREFKSAQETAQKWVGKFDAEVEFKKIDKNGGGFILFDEFCTWAISKSLDLEDDDD